ncbi:MAG TPA: sigma-70 family RNA polymerase sigma factor [Solirubrobacteraceae bacterium]|nr:sigma-70 family RNA polymerase sigma factor [Solirubrobacteraceae bacterium]
MWINLPQNMSSPAGAAHCAEPTRASGRRSQEEIQQLVARAAGGEEPAWNALVEEFSGLVWAIARAHRLGEADAADVAQLTWLRLVEHLRDLHDPGRVGSWLATTARRESLRLLHLARRNLPSDNQDLFDGESTDRPPDSGLLAAERNRALRRSLSRLQPRDRMLLGLLTSSQDFTYAEIAAALDMPIGSIGPTRARALGRLRRELERDETLATLPD